MTVIKWFTNSWYQPKVENKTQDWKARAIIKSCPDFGGFKITKYIGNKFINGFYFKATCTKTHKNGTGNSEISAVLDLMEYIRLNED